MPSTFSPNRSYNLQAVGDNNGTWGVVANSDFSIIDLNFGGRLNISVAGNSNITVTTTQARNAYHNLTGLLTGSINYDLPLEGMTYILSNNTTGAFTVTARCVGGTGVVIPQGTTVQVFVNPDTTSLAASSNYVPSTTGVFLAGTTSGTNTQTVTASTPGYSYTTQYTLIAKIGTTPTGAMTLNVNSLGAKNVYKIVNGGVIAISAGDLVAGQIAIFTYDGTQLQLINPSPAIEITMGLSSTPPAGSLIINGNSIGSAASGATKAAAIYANLYAYWWNNVSDTYAPVAGGRGANPAADFAANKALTMPNWADRSPYGIGSLLNAPAVTGGAATVAATGSISINAVTLSTGNLPNFSLTTGEAYSNTGTLSTSGVWGTGNVNVVTTTSSIGSNTPFTPTGSFTGSGSSVIHPVMGIYYYISY